MIREGFYAARCALAMIVLLAADAARAQHDAGAPRVLDEFASRGEQQLTLSVTDTAVDRVLSFRATGTRDVSPEGRGGDCIGYTNEAPSLLLTVSAPVPILRIFTRMSGDPTLVVRAPDGAWRCNDDHLRLDAQVEFRSAPAGVYRVWLGRTQLHESAGELHVTTIEDRTLATLRDERGQLVASGEICVTSDVQGAQVFIDGQLQQPAGCVRGVAYGAHVVSVRAQGFVPVVRRVEVTGRMQVSAMLRLNARGPATGLEREPLDMLESRCAQGQPLGCLTAARALVDGIEVAFAPDRAASLYDRACALQSAEACSIRASELWATDAQRALSYAVRGCAGRFALGCRYAADLLAFAMNRAPDDVEALRYATLGCDLGDLPSCATKGYLVANGRGAPANPAQGVADLRRACDGLIASGCRELGLVLQRGIGVAADAAGAFDAFESAARLGDLNARRAIGTLYVPSPDAQSRQRAAFALTSAACTAGRQSACRVAANTGLIPEHDRLVAMRAGCAHGDGELCSAGARVMLRSGLVEERSAAIAALERACQLAGVGCEALQTARAPSEAGADSMVADAFSSIFRAIRRSTPLAQRTALAPISPDGVHVIIAFSSPPPRETLQLLSAIRERFPTVRVHALWLSANRAAARAEDVPNFGLSLELRLCLVSQRALRSLSWLPAIFVVAGETLVATTVPLRSASATVLDGDIDQALLRLAVQRSRAARLRDERVR